MLTQERLKEILDYNPDTGVFTYKIDRANKKAGEVAGHEMEAGYVSITIDYRAYYAHHLAVLFVTGEAPPKGTHVDHRNYKKNDNKWLNIRVTTPSLNGHNRGGLNKNNTSGATGVHRRKGGRFFAIIWVDRRPITVGTFDTKAAAISAREAYRDAHGLR